VFIHSRLDRQNRSSSSSCQELYFRSVFEATDSEIPQHYDPLEWLAAIGSHVAERGQQCVRYYGAYANAFRGKQRKREAYSKNRRFDHLSHHDLTQFSIYRSAHFPEDSLFACIISSEYLNALVDFFESTSLVIIQKTWKRSISLPHLTFTRTDLLPPSRNGHNGA